MTDTSSTPPDLVRLGFKFRMIARGDWAVSENGVKRPWNYKSRKDAEAVVREVLGLRLLSA